MSNNTEMNETLKTEISRQCKKYDGSMKIPGSIVGGFTNVQIRLAVNNGWLKRVGNRTVITRKGYNEL